MCIKKKALALFLKVKIEEITETTYDEDTFEVETEPGEYRVLTDSEADEAFDEYMSSLIDECVLSEIPEAYRCYFDEEKFTRDVKINDGRGPSLASYDGNENEQKIEGEWFFIYRTN
jgi:hypothetical protein